MSLARTDETGHKLSWVTYFH